MKFGTSVADIFIIWLGRVRIWHFYRTLSRVTVSRGHKVEAAFDSKLQWRRLANTLEVCRMIARTATARLCFFPGSWWKNARRFRFAVALWFD